MAVRETYSNNALSLELDNGDLKKFQEAMSKWHFKDSQSMLRFAITLLNINEKKSFGILEDGQLQEVGPVDALLKE